MTIIASTMPEVRKALYSLPVVEITRAVKTRGRWQVTVTLSTNEG